MAGGFLVDFSCWRLRLPDGWAALLVPPFSSRGASQHPIENVEEPPRVVVFAGHAGLHRNRALSPVAAVPIVKIVSVLQKKLALAVVPNRIMARRRSIVVLGANGMVGMVAAPGAADLNQ